MLKARIANVMASENTPLTLEAIAADAGVSESTVYRYLMAHTDFQQAIKEIAPHVFARSMTLLYQGCSGELSDTQLRANLEMLKAIGPAFNAGIQFDGGVRKVRAEGIEHRITATFRDMLKTLGRDPFKVIPNDIQALETSDKTPYQAIEIPAGQPAAIPAPPLGRADVVLGATTHPEIFSQPGCVSEVVDGEE